MQNVCPLAFWYVPGVQLLQTAAPALADTDPAGHSMHVELEDAPDAPLYVPAEHNRHDVDPATSW